MVTWTSLAGAYPWELARAWAGLLLRRSKEVLAHKKLEQESQSPEGLDLLYSSREGTGKQRLLGRDRVAGYSHIDDHVVFGSDLRRVAEAAGTWTALLREGGFVVADAPPPGELDRYIGYATKRKPVRWILPAGLLADLTAALIRLEDLRVWRVGVVHFLLRLIIWCFLLRRPLLLVIFAVFGWLRDNDDVSSLAPPYRVRQELRTCRRLLPM